MRESKGIGTYRQPRDPRRQLEQQREQLPLCQRNGIPARERNDQPGACVGLGGQLGGARIARGYLGIEEWGARCSVQETDDMPMKAFTVLVLCALLPMASIGQPNNGPSSASTQGWEEELAKSRPSDALALGARSKVEASTQESVYPIDNLIAVVEVNPFEKDQKYEGRLYPLAVCSEGKYRDAGSGDGDENDWKERRSLLERVKDFETVYRNHRIGPIHVTPVEYDRHIPGFLDLYGAQGLTKFMEPDALLSLILWIKEPREPLEPWTSIPPESGILPEGTCLVAVSHLHLAPGLPRIDASLLGHLNEDLLEVATPLLNAATASENKEVSRQKGARILDVAILDLDHDGSPEVYAQLCQEVRYQESDLSIWGCDLLVSLVIGYVEGNPVLLWELSHKQGHGDDSTGFPSDGTHLVNFIGATDMDGDKIDEFLIRNDSYEFTNFSILRYGDHKLDVIFEGVGFGL